MNVRRILTSAIETQAFPTPDSGQTVTLCRHPIVSSIDIPIATAAGRLIQWTTPNNTVSGNTYTYTLTNEGTLVIAPGNVLPATDYLVTTTFGLPSTTTDSCLNLRHLELTCEHTGALLPAVPATSTITLTLNLLLSGAPLAIVLPIRLTYSGQVVQNHLTIPDGYTFSSAVITATLMTSLRITANLLAHPAAF